MKDKEDEGNTRQNAMAKFSCQVFCQTLMFGSWKFKGKCNKKKKVKIKRKIK